MRGEGGRALYYIESEIRDHCRAISCRIEENASFPFFPCLSLHINSSRLPRQLAEVATLHAFQLHLHVIPIRFHMLGVDASCLVDEVEGMVDCVVSGDGRELCHLAVHPPLI